MTRHAALRRVGDAAVVLLAVATELVVWSGWTIVRGGGDVPPIVVPLAVAVVFATLLARWRWPVPVLAINVGYAFVAAVLLPGYTPFAGVLIALHAVACTAGPRCGLLAGVACLVPFAVNCLNVAGGARPGAYGSALLTAAVLWLVMTTGVFGLGRLTFAARQRESLLERLRTKDAAEAVQAERLRMARELHDIVSHTVGAMILQAAGSRRFLLPDDERVRTALTTIEHCGVQAMTELHAMLGLLRGSPVADLDAATAGTPYGPGTPGIPDVDGLAAAAVAAGTDVTVAIDGAPVAVDDELGLTVYRVVQEGLTNATKHGGSGVTVAIRLRWEPDALRVTVHNTVATDVDAGGDGPVAMPGAGRGLAGLHERVQLVQGSLESHPVDGGFVLEAEFPSATANAQV